MIAILYDTSTNQVINRNIDVPVVAVNTGLSSSQQYFVPYIPNVLPDYDPRYYSGYTITETPTQIYHPEYPTYYQWLLTYTLIPQPVSEILAAINNAKQFANSQLIDQVLQTRAFGELIKKITGATYDQNVLDTLVAIDNKLQSNLDNAVALSDAVNNGQQPDIDAGWLVS